MDIYVVNKAYQTVGIVDVFESLIWTDRYNACGDFELYTSVDPVLVSLLQKGYYLKIKDSDRMMIIESIEIKTDVESGNKLVFKGRSLESILDRRIVWTQTLVNTNLEAAIFKVVDDAFITGVSSANRVISNFSVLASGNTAITGITIKRQFDLENIYDVVVEQCQTNNIGFKITLNSSNVFVFQLYAGVDRSYNQSTNPYVIFSPNFDNLLNSDFVTSDRVYKTITLIVGDESGTTSLIRLPKGLPGTSPVGGSGLDRKEVLTDASNLSRFVQGSSTPIDPTEYTLQLAQTGLDNLINNWGVINQFEGQASTVNTYVYQTDYFLGDIVQIENEYGMTSRSRITEVTFSENVNGLTVYPTFVTI